MTYKKFIGAIAAVALASTSTVSVAAGTAASAKSAPAPAVEAVDADSELRRTGILIPLAALAVIGAAIYLLLLKGGDDEKPGISA